MSKKLKLITMIEEVSSYIFKKRLTNTLLSYHAVNANRKQKCAQSVVVFFFRTYVFKEESQLNYEMFYAQEISFLHMHRTLFFNDCFSYLWPCVGCTDQTPGPSKANKTFRQSSRQSNISPYNQSLKLIKSSHRRNVTFKHFNCSAL